MKTEAQRIAIAGACGLKHPRVEEVEVYCDDVTEPGYVTRKLYLHDHGEVPNYPSDLNAAITLCDVLAKERFGISISKMTVGWVCNFIGNAGVQQAIAPTLSAAICEAFLRTFNLWTETDA